jgi:NAD(P)-dependent dehydrogenase (short-subunit alcohol dehydrogenase family)
MGEVTLVVGAGQIGQAIARRVSAGKHVVLADLHQRTADAAAGVLADAGFEVSTAFVDVSSRESVHALAGTATALGDVAGVIHAAGVSPSQASPEVILAVDLYGTALVLEEFGNVIAPGGSGVVIASTEPLLLLRSCSWPASACGATSCSSPTVSQRRCQPPSSPRATTAPMAPTENAGGCDPPAGRR